jgi:uracil-DNA glycosylase
MIDRPPPAGPLQRDLFADRGEQSAVARPGLTRSLATCFEDIGAAWADVIAPFVRSQKGQALIDAVDARVQHGAVVYPPKPFLALSCLAPERVRVVILGQDPYHGPNQALGRAFGVARDQRCPPSLRNILREVEADLGRPARCAQDLAGWESQGVLLLNTAFTVEDSQPMSHAALGWDDLSDAILAHVAQRQKGLVVMLWGAAAQRKSFHFEANSHLVLKANHPSPLSANRPPTPFRGCQHFSQANTHIASLAFANEPIEW